MKCWIVTKLIVVITLQYIYQIVMLQTYNVLVNYISIKLEKKDNILHKSQRANGIIKNPEATKKKKKKKISEHLTELDTGWPVAEFPQTVSLAFNSSAR